MKTSLGLLEVSGLALAINAADAMAKSASVTLVGIENTKGSGWMMIKITGDVAAVQSAISTGTALAEKHRGLVSKKVLSRPDAQLMKRLIPRPAEAVVTDIAASETAPAIPADIDTGAAEIVADEPADISADQESATPSAEEDAAVVAAGVTCNLCQDPLCPRQKGEPRNKCIHARGHA